METLEVSCRYKLESKIGEGTFGTVYSAIDKHTGSSAAVKLVYRDYQSLKQEATFLDVLEGRVGIPKVHLLHEQDNYAILVLDRLGPDLQELQDCCDGHFSLGTVILIAQQLIGLLKHLKDRGIVHRDVKPSNILLGTDKSGNAMHLVDFGLACWESNGTKAKTVACENLLVGTPNFASRSAHHFGGNSNFDDLESLAYVLISLQKKLPWDGLSNPDAIHKAKFQSAKTICQGICREFAVFLDYARYAKRNSRVDYGFLRRLFGDLGRRFSFAYKFSAYDWTQRTHECLERNVWKKKRGWQRGKRREITPPRTA